jgi:hypothetical protein|tara:strand:+ start:284 stop:1105 length:822 start_codon:yes stop_codon:yes gene_type:complete
MCYLGEKMFELIKLNITNLKNQNKINTSLKILIKQQKSITLLKNKLNQRSRKIKLLYTESKSKGDESSYSVYRNEYEEIIKLSENIRISELSIMRAIGRMETLKDIHSITNSLNLAVQECKNMEKSISEIIPTINQQILDLDTSVNNSLNLPDLLNNELIKTNSSVENNIIEPILRKFENKSENFESIVKNNRSSPIVNKKTQNYMGANELNFKEYSVNNKDKNLEEKINNYINEKHGAFDVVDAANELGLPIEIIESTAMTLKNKGKIKTSR